VLVLWLTVLFAGHPLVAHAVGTFAVEVFPGGLFGLRLGAIEGWHGGGFGALFRPARCGQQQQSRAQQYPPEPVAPQGRG